MIYLSIDFGIVNFAYSVINMYKYDILVSKLVDMSTYFTTDNYISQRYIKGINKLLDEIMAKYSIDFIIMENQMVSNSDCLML
jgi:Holliday junction resolvasome RuvABC endonuclease subunit